LREKEFLEIDDEAAVVSHNYYSEILFDYLTIFYKKIGNSLGDSLELKKNLR